MIQVRTDEFVAVASGDRAYIEHTAEYASEHHLAQGHLQFMSVDIDWLIDVLDSLKDQLEEIGFEEDDDEDLH